LYNIRRKNTKEGDYVKKIIAMLLVIFTIFSTTISASASTRGWVQENGKTYYIENGKKATGWKNIDGKRYLFKYADGSMITGWYTTVQGKRYYFEKNGAMHKYFMMLNGKKYYFNGEGVLFQNRWLNMDGKRYYCGKDGAFVKYLQKINGKTYYFYGDCSMHRYKLYVRDNSKYGWNAYYFDSNGVRAENKWVTFKDGKRYYGADGKRYDDFHTINGKKYYFIRGSGVLLQGKGRFILYNGTYDIDENGVVLRKVRD
jgi:glucan-binding YG repeat protein